MRSTELVLEQRAPLALGVRCSPTAVWLSLSLLVTALHAALGLIDGFSSPYAIQTDARQYVTWMVRYQDPSYFPDDPIADYFHAVSPPGYRAFFWWLIAGGADPFIVAKLVPVALGLVVTAYAFRLCLRLLPSAPAAFVATVILNQNLWMTDDLISATPRAFGFPILVAFLYYLARRSLAGTMVTVALGGLFYPQVAVVAAGTLVLSLVRWQGGRPVLTRDRHDLLIASVGVLVALALLTFGASRASVYGPAMPADEARTLPIFLPGGRAEFFFADPWEFWVERQRSGFLRQPFGPPLIWAGLLLPVLLLARRAFPLAARLVDGARPLPQLLVASCGLFFLAHALLFRLYLPGRYAQHSVRIALSIAAGLALALIAERILAIVSQRILPGLAGRIVPIADPRVAPSVTGCIIPGVAGRIVTGSARPMTAGVTEPASARRSVPASPIRPSSLPTVLVGAALLLVLFAPTLGWLAEGELPDARYRQGEEPSIYRFLAAQPHDTLVASLSEIADFIPPFARRSVVIGPKYALPYHTEYHREMDRRARDLVRAQYTPDLAALQDVTRRYSIDYWLVRRSAFSVEYVEKSWFEDVQPETRHAAEQLRQGITPALMQLVDRCAAHGSGSLVLVRATCILDAPIYLRPVPAP